MTAEAFPLHWPEGWPRSETQQRSEFRATHGQAVEELVREIRLLGGRYPVVSSNVPVRQDGLPYAKYAQPKDNGVAVYFERKGKQMVFACDRWDRVKDNIRAIQKTIEAMRGIERWGASDMLERAFSAFEALPAPGEARKRHWREVFAWPDGMEAGPKQIEVVYRALAKERHPDAGGSDEAFHELQQAREEALREVKI